MCRLILLAKSITAEECARQLVTAISTELSIPPELAVAAMRDRAKVNDVAMRTISVIYNQMMGVKCFSHTLDRVGDKMNTPILERHGLAYLLIVLRQDLHGKHKLDLLEVIEQVHNAFGDVSQYLDSSYLQLQQLNYRDFLRIHQHVGNCS